MMPARGGFPRFLLLGLPDAPSGVLSANPGVL